MATFVCLTCISLPGFRVAVIVTALVVVAIFIAVLGSNLFGDALRDVLDPRNR